MPQGQKPRCSPRRAALPRHVCDPSAGCMVFLSGRCGWTREILKIGKGQGGACTSYVTCTRLRYIVSSSVPSSHCVLHFVMFWYVVVCTVFSSMYIYMWTDIHGQNGQHLLNVSKKGGSFPISVRRRRRSTRTRTTSPHSFSTTMYT